MMKEFQDPIFKVINIKSQDVISTSVVEEDIDNKMMKASDIFGTGDFQEDIVFISG